MPLLKTILNKIKDIESNKADRLNITTGQEYETGRTIDGKKEYGQIISCGKLLDADTLDIPFSASGKNNIRYEGTAIAGSYIYEMMPFKGNSDYCIVLQYSVNNFHIMTYNSAYTDYDAIIYVYYTKTS